MSERKLELELQSAKTVLFIAEAMGTDKLIETYNKKIEELTRKIRLEKLKRLEQ